MPRSPRAATLEAEREARMRRILLLIVAALLSASALLAVGILLFGRFGETEGRILGTTALVAGYGLLALPGAILFDQHRLRRLGASVGALAVAGATLALVSVWAAGSGDRLGKWIGTVTLILVAAAQTAALAARNRDRDPRSVRVLFTASIIVGAAAAGMLTGLLWSEAGDDYGRFAAALVVLDAGAVALQPILARARVEPGTVRLRVLVDEGDTVDLDVQARDLAAAAAKAIRTVEGEGRRFRSLERLDGYSAPVPAPEPNSRIRSA